MEKKNKRDTSRNEKQPYEYSDSGIQEHHGNIPAWLIIVALGLIIWSVYYTVKYW
ncbi:MAG: cbb3-type cytochrome c oxidase N-terminal domain-containing protein [Nitrospinota bacterium]